MIQLVMGCSMIYARHKNYGGHRHFVPAPRNIENGNTKNVYILMKSFMINVLGKDSNRQYCLYNTIRQ